MPLRHRNDLDHRPWWWRMIGNCQNALRLMDARALCRSSCSNFTLTCRAHFTRRDLVNSFASSSPASSSNQRNLSLSLFLTHFGWSVRPASFVSHLSFTFYALASSLSSSCSLAAISFYASLFIIAWTARPRFNEIQIERNWLQLPVAHICHTFFAALSHLIPFPCLFWRPRTHFSDARPFFSNSQSAHLLLPPSSLSQSLSQPFQSVSRLNYGFTSFQKKGLIPTRSFTFSLFDLQITWFSCADSTSACWTTNPRPTGSAKGKRTSTRPNKVRTLFATIFDILIRGSRSRVALNSLQQQTDQPNLISATRTLIFVLQS